jgi:hypothetical protein
MACNTIQQTTVNLGENINLAELSKALQAGGFEVVGSIARHVKTSAVVAWTTGAAIVSLLSGATSTLAQADATVKRLYMARRIMTQAQRFGWKTTLDQKTGKIIATR